MVIKSLFVLSVILCVFSMAVHSYWGLADGARFSRTMQDIEMLAEIDDLEREVYDPWERPYLQVTAKSGSKSAAWYFSLGPDGQSKTLGNDPDDIAPWTGSQEWLDASHPASRTLWIGFVTGVVAISLGSSLATSRYLRKRLSPQGFGECSAPTHGNPD